MATLTHPWYVEGLSTIYTMHIEMFCSKEYYSSRKSALIKIKQKGISDGGLLLFLSYTAPSCTDPADTRLFLGPKIFQFHGFPNVVHSFTPQLHGYELGPIVKKVTQFLSYTVFQNTLRHCNSGPYCSQKKVLIFFIFR